MADNISAIPQQPQLGRLAQFLRYLETQNAPEFLPKQLDVMGLVRQLALPQASTVENLSYGNLPFTMPPSGTGAMIPQVKTGRKAEVADLVGMLGGVPGVGAVADVGTKLFNEAADALVRMITRNPQAAAPGVLQETAMPFMKAVAPRGMLDPSPELNLQMAREAAEKMGLSTDEQTRMLQLGFDPGWYHGTTGDVKNFRLDLLGEATGAESAKKGFFFARDPISPPEGTVVQTGSGPRTASGYSMIGGDREYRDAMRKAAVAEKNRNWDEYEKQMQIAEDFAMSRVNKSQELVAKYGEARDVMIDKVQNAFYNKKLTQQEAEALDQKFRELMPYGWYNQFSKEQFDALKAEIRKTAPDGLAKQASNSIDEFIKIKNERALNEQTQSGSNVIPVALRYKNPLVYDFKGSAYRDTTYAELVEKARQQGNDAVILKNTYDPGAGKAELVDVGVVFDPSQIRSRFAAFDPTRTKEGNILAGAFPIGLLGDEGE